MVKQRLLANVWYAGAIISGGKGTAAEKIKTMEACGIKVAETPAVMGETLISVLKEKGLFETCKTINLLKDTFLLEGVFLHFSVYIIKIMGKENQDEKREIITCSLLASRLLESDGEATICRSRIKEHI